MLNSRFILIFHIDMVDCNFIRSSNMNNLILEFGQYSPIQFGNSHFWGKITIWDHKVLCFFFKFSVSRYFCIKTDVLSQNIFCVLKMMFLFIWFIEIYLFLSIHVLIFHLQAIYLQVISYLRMISILVWFIVYSFNLYRFLIFHLSLDAFFLRLMLIFGWLIENVLFLFRSWAFYLQV